MLTIRTGQRVLIRGKAGKITGLLEDVRDLDHLMEIDGMNTAEVRNILAESGIDRLALISYTYWTEEGPEEVVFAAPRTPAELRMLPAIRPRVPHQRPPEAQRRDRAASASAASISVRPSPLRSADRR